MSLQIINTDMYVPFENLPDSARVWVYQSAEPFTDAQQAALTEALDRFVAGWESHGIPLHASFQIQHNHFIVLAVNEIYKDASGCSIDKSVRFLQELQSRLTLNLFDRSQQAFLAEGQMRFVEVKNMKQEVQSGNVLPETLTFNNLVATAGQLRDAWLVPAKDAWLARYFRQVPQV